MGGEKLTTFDAGKLIPGSPPRGRGKGVSGKHCIAFSRITPAWAGKSVFVQFYRCVSWDHPRVGGEKFRESRSLSVLRGSPPRGRGKVVGHRCVLLDVGITPAWAGKRNFSAKTKANIWDHPRVGGEKSTKQKSGGKDTGSPPRGRGKGTSTCTKFVYLRITPAWAGKRKSMYASSNTG